jgi:hypothetical protein
MNPSFKFVQPNKDCTLNLTFDNNESKIFDVKRFLGEEMFKELKELSLFYSLKPS